MKVLVLMEDSGEPVMGLMLESVQAAFAKKSAMTVQVRLSPEEKRESRIKAMTRWVEVILSDTKKSDAERGLFAATFGVGSVSGAIVFTGLCLVFVTREEVLSMVLVPHAGQSIPPEVWRVFSQEVKQIASHVPSALMTDNDRSLHQVLQDTLVEGIHAVVSRGFNPPPQKM
ncbi:MAG: hypothetical protein V4474_04330 [Patescibacteria group bacterium]